jgi:hypothetical protein
MLPLLFEAGAAPPETLPPFGNLLSDSQGSDCFLELSFDPHRQILSLAGPCSGVTNCGMDTATVSVNARCCVYPADLARQSPRGSYLVSGPTSKSDRRCPDFAAAWLVLLDRLFPSRVRSFGLAFHRLRSCGSAACSGQHGPLSSQAGQCPLDPYLSPGLHPGSPGGAAISLSFRRITLSPHGSGPLGRPYYGFAAVGLRRAQVCTKPLLLG